MRDFKVRTKLSTIFTTLHLGQQQSVFPSIFHVANYALSHEEAGAVFRLERNRTDTVFKKSPKSLIMRVHFIDKSECKMY